ncbi:rod shape-determining protein MreB [Legionella moravica]|uniref:Rod shape-determining protein MreB n=1 Tax=Legionella moravica TaxID=39962 RepID=A0A378JY51_9GAMM|nr:hypothetical protein [Legionella moravica]KTD35343.1 rod shape-determining protein MreB [Legionella moravica]STX61949.1 rod shape-determining protein MreB [Legionella moravica]
MRKLLVGLILISSLAHAKCMVYMNNKPLGRIMHDPLFVMLSSATSCPVTIHELKKIIDENGMHEQISMVANRGRNNPYQGSFSFFESIFGRLPGGSLIARGDLFLGYFTDVHDSEIILDQQSEPRKLLIEAIAWDKQKGFYNFYELRGIEHNAVRWFYRGDSADAYQDNKWLYRDTPKEEHHFGHRMRCSACHNSGGPILKELEKPHNDWWTVRRPLILTPNSPDNEVKALLNEVEDAALFTKDVSAGLEKLARSKSMAQFQKKLSLQEQLRPLFCTTEINIESSTEQSDRRIVIPSSFWLHPLLGRIDVSVSRQDYEQVLQEFDMQFPETTLRDADHAWLTPVNAKAGIQMIHQLIHQNVINKHFAESVLMVDFTHPLFSSQRCDLLKLLPEQSTGDWLNSFLNNLRENSAQFQGATLLADYLANDAYTHEVFMKYINQYRDNLNQLVSTLSGVRSSYQHLMELRELVYASELSHNPLGQILEPGFRVIFSVSMLNNTMDVPT